MKKTKVKIKALFLAVFLVLQIAVPAAAQDLTAGTGGEAAAPDSLEELQEDMYEVVSVEFSDPVPVAELAAYDSSATSDSLFISNEKYQMTFEKAPMTEEEWEMFAGAEAYSLGQSSAMSAAAARAALPDLRVSEFKTTVSEPIPTHVEVPYSFAIGNIGSAKAPDFLFEFSVDGTVGLQEILEELEPGWVFRATISTTMVTAGSHTSKIEVNRTRTFTESDYTNNVSTVTKNYAVSNGYVDLTVMDIVPENTIGNNRFPLNEPVQVHYVIFNRGTKDANGFDIEFYINGALMKLSNGSEATIKNYSLPAGYGTYMTLNLQFHVATDVHMAAWVDRQMKMLDVDYSNNYLGKWFTTGAGPNQDCGPELWRVYWPSSANMKSISMAVSPQIDDMYGKVSVSTCGYEWDLHCSNIAFKSATVYNGNLSNSGAMMTFDTADFGAGSDTVGQTQPVHANTGYPIQDVYVSAPIGRVDIYISFKHVEKGDPIDVRNTFVHEIGHALTLAHPDCTNASVMHWPGDNGFSYNVEEHDRYNVRNMTFHKA